jgi:hypothetical protein
MGELQVHLHKQQHQHRYPKARLNHPRHYRQTQQLRHGNNHRLNQPMDSHHPPRLPPSKDHCHMRISSRQYPRHLGTYHSLHTTTSYAQTATPHNQLLRCEFQKDLIIFLQSKLDEGHEIALCGDLNEELGSITGGMSQFASNLGLIDIHAQTHGLDSKVATYTCGLKQLDYFLHIVQLASHSTNCGAEPFNHRFYSNHHGILVNPGTPNPT